MQCVHHRLELGDLPAGLAGPDRRRIRLMRGEVADRVVTPVVGQAPFDQERLRHALVHGEQFEGGHAQVEQVADDGLVGQPGVAATQRRGHVRVPHGEAFDVRLVDDRVLVAVDRPVIVGPVELLAGDQAARHLGRGVHGRGRVAVGSRVGQDLRAGGDRPSQRLRVRVEEQFRRVAAQPAGWVVGAGDPVAIPLAHLDAWHEAVPDSRIKITQRNPVLGARLIEQAQVDALGHVRGHREVGAVLASGGAQRERGAGQRHGRTRRVAPRAACRHRPGHCAAFGCPSLTGGPR